MGRGKSASSEVSTMKRHRGWLFLTIVPLILDLSAKDCVFPGREMEVFREGEAFKHPVTGEVMGKMEKAVAFLRVVEVRDRYSVAEVLDQDVAVKQGDGVRVTGARILLGVGKVDAASAGEGAGKTVGREIEV